MPVPVEVSRVLACGERKRVNADNASAMNTLHER